MTRSTQCHPHQELSQDTRRIQPQKLWICSTDCLNRTAPKSTQMTRYNVKHNTHFVDGHQPKKRRNTTQNHDTFQQNLNVRPNAAQKKRAEHATITCRADLYTLGWQRTLDEHVDVIAMGHRVTPNHQNTNVRNESLVVCGLTCWLLRCGCGHVYFDQIFTKPAHHEDKPHLAPKNNEDQQTTHPLSSNTPMLIIPKTNIKQMLNETSNSPNLQLETLRIRRKVRTTT